jgi:hypothetical protein
MNRTTPGAVFGAAVKALAAAGIDFSSTPAELERALAERQGARRYARHAATFDRYAAGEVDARALYATLRDLDEALLFQSYDAATLAATTTHLALAAILPAPRGARVVELGAFTGVAAAAFARLRPDLSFVACDRLAPLLRSASARFGGRRLRFLAASYAALAAGSVSAPRADVVVSACGLNAAAAEASYSLRSALDPEAPLHRAARAEAAPLFRAARRCGGPSAIHVHVVRAPRAARGYAYLDAAVAAGFSFDAARSRRFVVGDDAFLLLALAPAPSRGAAAKQASALPTPAEFAAFWHRDLPLAAETPHECRDDEAAARYEALPDRRPATAKTLPAARGRAATRRETGTARGFRYEFELAADGAHRLRLFPTRT